MVRFRSSVEIVRWMQWCGSEYFAQSLKITLLKDNSKLDRKKKITDFLLEKSIVCKSRPYIKRKRKSTRLELWWSPIMVSYCLQKTAACDMILYKIEVRRPIPSRHTVRAGVMARARLGLFRSIFRFDNIVRCTNAADVITTMNNSFDGGRVNYNNNNYYVLSFVLLLLCSENDRQKKLIEYVARVHLQNATAVWKARVQI